jgi:hypothetical protein
MTPPIAIAARDSLDLAHRDSRRRCVLQQAHGPYGFVVQQKNCVNGAPFPAVGYGRRASSTRPQLAFALQKLLSTGAITFAFKVRGLEQYEMVIP